MSDTIISPNMLLPVPVVGVDPGPQYATDVNSCMALIDAHNHSAGYGVQVPPAGLDINSDLTFQNNNGTDFRSVRLFVQSAPLALASDLNCLYDASGDLYFNDAAGNQIRITQGGAVAGPPGTITGLPSGTASASYSAGVFTFQSATNTPANLDAGCVVFRNNVANSFGLELCPPNAMGADFNLVLPNLPGTQSFMTLDAAGNMAAPWTVDNVTIDINANQVEVKNQGITAAKIANLTITGAQIADNSIPLTKLIGSFTTTPVFSASSGALVITTTGADTSIYSVTIMSNGSAIAIGLFADGSTNNSIFSTDKTTLLRLFSGIGVGGSVLASNQYQTGNTSFQTCFGTPGMIYVDVQSAGTYDYTIAINNSIAGTTTNFQYMKLVAWNL